MSFVVERLAAADRDIAWAAAIALGEARRPEATGALRERLAAENRPDVHHATVLGLATARDETAVAVLLELIAASSAADSRAAREALALSTRTTTSCSVACRRHWPRAGPRRPAAVRRAQPGGGALSRGRGCRIVTGGRSVPPL
jgi:HEAT repeat protein